jgi:hypothetical protein
LLDADKEEPIDCDRKDHALKRGEQSDKPWDVVLSGESPAREPKRVIMIFLLEPPRLIAGENQSIRTIKSFSSYQNIFTK